MGNTSSSSSSASTKLRRDPSIISGPRALGSLSSPRSRSRPLGPEHIISPYQSTSPTADSYDNAGHDTSQLSPINEMPRVVKERRSQIFSASRTSLRPTEGSVDVRRSRSANVSGPSRAERTSELLGAPPPYTFEDASSSNLNLSNFNTSQSSGYLDVPGSPYREKGHRRAASDVTPRSSRTDVRSRPSLDGSYGLVSEEYGYGVGNGLGASSRNGRAMIFSPDSGSSSPTELVSSPTSTFSPGHITEDPLDLLRQYKTIFLIDDSSSMAGERWLETREALAALAETAAKYDTDGIDAYFLNANRAAQNMRSASSVKRQFDSVVPQGISLLGKKLEELLHEYLAELERAEKEIARGDLRALQRVKPVNYIVLTDGVPTDDPEDVIVQAARRLDRANMPLSQVGIQFVQVGDDPRATEALKELDDGLAKEYGIRDMVDSTPYSGGTLDSELLIKILLGGINRRVDKKGARSVLS